MINWPVFTMYVGEISRSAYADSAFYNSKCLHGYRTVDSLYLKDLQLKLMLKLNKTKDNDVFCLIPLLRPLKIKITLQ